MRAAATDPTGSRFEYVRVGDRNLRQRKILNGIDNTAMKRSDLTNI